MNKKRKYKIDEIRVNEQTEGDSMSGTMLVFNIAAAKDSVRSNSIEKAWSLVYNIQQ